MPAEQLCSWMDDTLSIEEQYQIYYLGRYGEIHFGPATDRNREQVLFAWEICSSNYILRHFDVETADYLKRVAKIEKQDPWYKQGAQRLL